MKWRLPCRNGILKLGNCSNSYEAIKCDAAQRIPGSAPSRQEQSCKIQEQEAMISQPKKDFQATTAEQQQEIRNLAATVKEQARQIQQINTEFTTKSSVLLTHND
jgi:hypothetical protein